MANMSFNTLTKRTSSSEIDAKILQHSIKINFKIFEITEKSKVV